MAGTRPGFAAGFRKAIHTAMEIGAAPTEGERATFHFPSVLTYNGSWDSENVPFDPAATVTSAEPTPIQVDCAIEYFDAEDQATNFGLLAPSHLAITVLDEEYAQVKGCSYVVVHGDRYDYRRTEPPSGLFDVGVFTLHFASRNES